jgi:cell division protease FtsH
MGSLGHTLQLPTDERYLLTREELTNRMTVLLGGRAAEVVVYGQVSTGAHNDIERASRMARRMVTEYGMSERMGPVSWEQERRNYLWSDGSNQKDYSPQTAREIDEEVQKVLTEVEQTAIRTLTANRNALERIAARLMETELIEREELEGILTELGTPRAGAGDASDVPPPRPDTGGSSDGPPPRPDAGASPDGPPPRPDTGGSPDGPPPRPDTREDA